MGLFNERAKMEKGPLGESMRRVGCRSDDGADAECDRGERARGGKDRPAASRPDSRRHAIMH